MVCARRQFCCVSLDGQFKMSNTLVRRKGKIFVAPRCLPVKKATLPSRDPRGSKTRLGHPRGSAPTMTVHVDPAALWDSRRCATHQQSVRRDGLSAPPADQLWSATASGRRATTDGEPAPPQRGKRPLVLHKHAPTRRNRPRHRHPSAGSRRDYTNYP